MTQRNMAMFVSFSLMLCACATDGAKIEDRYGAYGYLSPTATGDAELIGVYPSRAACNNAAKEWEATQVVGNPVIAECYPVDKN